MFATADRATDLRVLRVNNKRAYCGLWLTAALALIGNRSWATGVLVRAVVAPVIVLHDGDPTPHEVKARMLLGDADELLGGTANSSLQLECPNGATQTLTDRFRAVINSRAAKSRCAIDLKTGMAVATTRAAPPNKTTDGDASISGGPYALTSHHTQFGLAITPGANANTEAFVIDGEAVVSAANATVAASLRSGQRIDAFTKKATGIPEPIFRRIATAYVQLDLAQLGRRATPQIASILQTQWLATLKQPTNADARKALAETHASLNLNTSLVSQYQVAQQKTLRSAFLANTFPNPMQGPYRLDYCLHYSKTSGAFGGCGNPAANAWCKTRGFVKAKQWVIARDIGAVSPTSVIGDDRICRAAACDGFASITCE
jgi:hypothetical protein